MHADHPTTESCPESRNITAALLAWISAGRRDLPWRRRRDAYAVWISEIMLQQTQVATATPYFDRWMIRFPDVRSLAAAPLEDVLKTWEGLGYYARARNVHAAAQQIVARHDSELPADRDSLLRLPGIGRYTAGAILSLAFGQAEPVLDGNVRRVLCRLYDIAANPREPAVEKHLWALADALVKAAPAGHYGDLNEGLMELGARVCTPAKPTCTRCPLAALCRAHAASVEADRPSKVARPRTPHYHVTAAVIQDSEGRYLIIQRRPAGLLGGLWGFPGSAAGDCDDPTVGETASETVSELPAGPNPESLRGCLTRAVAANLGLQVSVGEPLPVVKHAYTHFRITLHPFRCRPSTTAVVPLTYADARWVQATDLQCYAFPVTDRRIVEKLSI